MNAAVTSLGRWSKVERVTSLCLISSLLAFIGTRLIFAVWWPLHPLDFIVSAIAVVLLMTSFWFPPRRRHWRIAIITCAGASQLLPLAMRQPIMLLPILGAMIPLAILFACLVALSKKDRHPRQVSSS